MSSCPSARSTLTTSSRWACRRRMRTCAWALHMPAALPHSRTSSATWQMPSMPCPAPQIYRSFDIGKLAKLIMLDTRIIGRDPLSASAVDVNPFQPCCLHDQIRSCRCRPGCVAAGTHQDAQWHPCKPSAQVWRIHLQSAPYRTLSEGCHTSALQDPWVHPRRRSCRVSCWRRRGSRGGRCWASRCAAWATLCRHA
jgi:PhoD-like phosphatase